MPFLNRLAVAGTLVGLSYSSVSARCANDCNGKGECNAFNQCDCFPNFRGPDCSFRICPAGKAFVDTPLGDIDGTCSYRAGNRIIRILTFRPFCVCLGDGDVGIDLVYMKDVSRQPVSELYHVDYAAARPAFMNTLQWDEAHFYAECSNKGDCDPIEGVCNCYPGFDGSACNRNTCPDDCSGHGTCKNYEGSSYAAWDIEATTYCDCDPRWIGPSCSLRACRQGVDPVETANVDTSRMQRIAFKAIGPLAWDDADFDMGSYPLGDVYFTLTATDEYGDEWTTELITVKYDAFFAGAEDVAQVYFLPRLLKDDELVGKHSRNHVSQTIEDALEGLPHNSMGDVTVSEIYSMISVTHLDGEFDSFEFYFTNYSDLGCGLSDIYGQDTSRSIIGCGLPTADQYLGEATGNDRNGQLDINQYLADDVPYIMLVGTGDLYDPLNYDSPIVVDATSADIQPGTDNAQGHVDVGNAAGDVFSYGYAYYMYPHYNNDDSAEVRFPLFADPEVSTSDFYTEEYSSFLLFDFDADVADLTTTSTDYLAGLSLFTRFEKTTIQTLTRVDYFFQNENLLLFENYKSSITVTDWGNLLNQPGYDEVKGTTQEGCSATVCDNAYELVRIDDVGAYRAWDILYHGIQKYFLGDGNLGSDAELHECSKRGLCDFETGICDCFAGYTGLDCGTVNALAYGI